MENTTIIDKLSLFGLTRQEATLYFCLLRNDELTGYEVAKLTGISRSNVYNGLAALVEHGAAYICEGTTNSMLLYLWRNSAIIISDTYRGQWSIWSFISLREPQMPRVI